MGITTKSGSNEWKFGALATWSAESLRSTRKSVYQRDNGAPNAGKIYTDRSGFEDDYFTYGAYASGPLIKDRLFIYASGEWTDRDFNQNQAVTAASRTASIGDNIKTPRWMTKVDWNINDNRPAQ
ncbi:hypothetical protein RLIN73S_05621 [Rhodanobacter lindaniclasticus]